MTEKNLANPEGEVLRDKTIKDLADDGGEFTILGTLEITPGYNPSSEYTEMPHPNFPIDKYATKVSLSSSTSITIEKSNRPIDQSVKSLREPRGLKRYLPFLAQRENAMAIPSENEYVYGVHAQVGKKPELNDSEVFRTSDADVWCSPAELPPELHEHINSKQEIMLQESLLIKPDYSNLPGQEKEKILTTKDLFSISIRSGARVFLERGGSIGNIKIHIVEGNLFIPCNPDIKIPPVRRNV